jgi:hypothetical protein
VGWRCEDSASLFWLGSLAGRLCRWIGNNTAAGGKSLAFGCGERERGADTFDESKRYPDALAHHETYGLADCFGDRRSCYADLGAAVVSADSRAVGDGSDRHHRFARRR